MAKKKRMPVNVLVEQPAVVETGSAVDEIVAGRAAGATEPEPPPETFSEPPVVAPLLETVEAPAPKCEPVAEPPRPRPLPTAGPKAEQAEDQRLRRGEDAVVRRVLVSALVGLVPWPFLALLILVGLNVESAHALAAEYRTPFERVFPRAVAAAFLGAVLAVVLGRAGADVLKYLPLAGSLLGVAFRGCAAAASAYVVGQLFLRDHEAGGTLLSRDPRATPEYFRKKFRGGDGAT